MMISKSKAITIISALFFFIWIIVAPQIISQIREEGELPLYETQYRGYDYSGVVTYSIEALDFNPSNYREVVGLKGWSFMDLDGNIKQRKIEILFLSEKRNYKVETKTFKKPDIVQIYEPDSTDKVNDEFGFETKFSAITIKNGEYKIAIAIHENDNEKVEYIGKILKKEAGRISFLDDNKTDRTEFVEFKDTFDSLPEALGFVDALVDLGGEVAYINGWACKDVTPDIKSRNVYVILASNEITYKAPLRPISRYGLIKFLNQNAPLDSTLSPAYKGFLNYQNIKDGEYKLFLLVNENNTNYLQKPDIVIKKQEKVIKIEKK